MKKLYAITPCLLMVLSSIALFGGVAVSEEPKKLPTQIGSSVHPQIGLVTIIQEVLSENQELQSIEEQIAALRYRIPQAGAWKDPQLGVSYVNAPVDTFSLGEFGMTGIEVGYSQTIPFFGKTALREEVASGHLREKQWGYKEKQNALKSLVRKSYYSLSLTRQMEKITVTHITLVKQFLAAVKYKYETGTTGQHDYLRLKVLRDELVDQLGDYKKDAATLVALINKARHCPPSTPVKTPNELKAHKSPFTVDSLLEQAKAERPELFRLKEEEKTFRTAERLARKEAYPDLTMQLKYRYRAEVSVNDDGTDFATAGFSIPIPVFYNDRYGAKAEENAAEARATRKSYHSTVDEISSRIKSVLATLDRAYEKADTYENQLLPDAKTTLDATFAAYQVDRASFASFYQAELKLLDFDRALRVAQATTHMALAELEMIIGKDFS